MSQYFDNLVSKLTLLGYHQHQINQMICEIVDGEEISQLSEEKEQLVLKTLQDYVDFAVKCLKTSKSE